jgi:hypothetical protein
MFMPIFKAVNTLISVKAGAGTDIGVSIDVDVGLTLK